MQMLTFCQGLEGKYLSNDVLPKVQLVPVLKELHQKDLGLWFLALLTASANAVFYPLKSCLSLQENTHTHTHIYILQAKLKAKHSFDLIPPSSTQPVQRWRRWGHCTLTPVQDV